MRCATTVGLADRNRPVEQNCHEPALVLTSLIRDHVAGDVADPGSGVCPHAIRQMDFGNA